MNMIHHNNTGKPNRLIEEKSPYLLQHSHNPVKWYSWSKEAFATASREDKPVFLSIGYSTCHWCHVMARESFEDPAIADILNKHFISIKVDREERPDIDQIYMAATQAVTGAGGWPMSVFLLPDKRPFYAGTYFPPEPHLNHPGFAELLTALAHAWTTQKRSLEATAEKLTEHLRDSLKTGSHERLDENWSTQAFAALNQNYDTSYHGFGTRNKFPRPSCFSFLLAYGKRTGNRMAFEITRKTLEAIALGGIHDHIGGGFHRYSVDRQWRVPHFEKMLCDQAQLAVSYLQMYQQTDDPFFADVAEKTIRYVLRDLQHPDGVFFSAEDADSINPYNEDTAGEGAFYLWTENEIRQILDETDGRIFNSCYGVRPRGNVPNDLAGEFGDGNILFLEKNLTEMADTFGKSEKELKLFLKEAAKKLRVQRDRRTRPHRDEKILTAWNGLMLSALAQAGRILNAPEYLDEAGRVVQFFSKNMGKDGRLQRCWYDGKGHFDGVLQDYTFLIQGLLDLYAATYKEEYLQKAVELSDKQIEIFADPAGGFYDSAPTNDLIIRMKETYDGAEPSGNSVAALNFLRLGRMLNRAKWLSIAEKTIKTFDRILNSNSSALPLMLTALELSFQAPKKDRTSRETSAKHKAFGNT
ncbi:MAG: thioredoxin domain-containing protein [Desulfopila sp.]|jgi:uncharacterized protein YyaL (SSP411 family)|nr:thioredoxin domain-containing protein [Desulfopila sp.]